MIHAFALEPRLVATWGSRAEFRFFHDKFGLGTPRVLLELPKFSTWKREVYEAARALGLPDEDMQRIAELFRLFADHKYRRPEATYDRLRMWLDNAEAEYQRRPFTGILATHNPRGHEAVLVPDLLGPGTARWMPPLGASPARTSEGLAAAIGAMLSHCRELHVVDPHFGPENERHRAVLEALMDVVDQSGASVELIRLHCSAKSGLAFFESEAHRMAARLPPTVTIEFVRWRQRERHEPGERLHNRYVLTDVGGVALGVGLDVGEPGTTDDVLLLPRDQYTLRWSQYAGESGFECVDRPVNVVGTRVLRPRR